MINFLAFVWEWMCMFGIMLYASMQFAWENACSLFNGGRAEKSIRGCNVVLTGACGGIGSSLAHQLLEEGCNLALIDLRTEEVEKFVEELTEEANRFDATCHGFSCDITNQVQVTKTFSSIRSQFGKIHIVINNAGIALGKGFIDQRLSQIRHTIEVNCLSHLTIIKEVLPNMISEGNGHIVAIASVAGLFGFGVNNVDYVASKYGVVGYMEALDYELHAKGINTVDLTTICPYIVETPLFAGCELTKFPHANPVLMPQEVARYTIDGIKKRKRIVPIPKRFWLFVFCKLLFPRTLVFRLLDMIGTDTSMNHFVGRHSHVNN